MVPAMLPLAQALSSIASFDQKPAKPIGPNPTPVIARVPATITQKVNGISFFRPP